MTDTLREQVARVIRSEHRIRRDFILNFDELTDAVLAVAEPAIRAKVIEELIAATGATERWRDDGSGTFTQYPAWTIADWLRAQGETTP